MQEYLIAWFGLSRAYLTTSSPNLGTLQQHSLSSVTTREATDSCRDKSLEPVLAEYFGRDSWSNFFKNAFGGLFGWLVDCSSREVCCSICRPKPLLLECEFQFYGFKGFVGAGGGAALGAAISLCVSLQEWKTHRPNPTGDMIPIHRFTLSSSSAAFTYILHISIGLPLIPPKPFIAKYGIHKTLIPFRRLRGIKPPIVTLSLTPSRPSSSRSRFRPAMSNFHDGRGGRSASKSNQPCAWSKTN